MRLSGKTAIITGGGTGIGRGIALSFAKDGATVVVMGRRLEPLEEVCKAAGAERCSAIQCDQADPAAVAAACQAAVARLGGKVDILVNNAGTNIAGRSLDKLSVEDWKTVVDVNLNGPFYFCHSILPLMRAQNGGTVINISSIAAIRNTPPSGASCASSAATIASSFSFRRCCASERCCCASSATARPTSTAIRKSGRMLLPAVVSRSPVEHVL